MGGGPAGPWVGLGVVWSLPALTVPPDGRGQWGPGASTARPFAGPESVRAVSPGKLRARGSRLHARRGPEGRGAPSSWGEGRGPAQTAG